VTTDQNIEKQQNLRKVGIRLIVLVAKSNKLRALLPLVPQLKDEACSCVSKRQGAKP
jgi:hypothetical protein